MAAYESEQEQIEELKKWWKENGSSIVTGILLGLVILGGWRGWEAYTTQRSETASGLYEQILLALEQGQADKAREVANTLLSGYSRSPYASLAQLGLASQDLKEGNKSSSQARLQWLIDQNLLPQLTHIARLRKVKLFLAEGKLDEAKKFLENIPENGQFKGSYTELRGDIAVLQGQEEVARKLYQEALVNGEELFSSEQRNLIQTKLDNLGVAPADRIEASAPVPLPPLPVEATPSTTQNNVLTIPSGKASSTNDKAPPKTP